MTPFLRPELTGSSRKGVSPRPTILWQSRAQLLLDSARKGELHRRANGGNAYDFHAMKALARAYDVFLDDEAVRREREGPAAYWWRLRSHRPRADLVVKEPSLVSLGRIGEADVEVGIIHHISFDLWKKSSGHRLFFSRLVNRLPRLDAVVTVSKYWRGELERLGCRRVEIIYNSFDPNEFDVAPQEVEAFKRKHDLPADRPLVYIGNTGAQKGVAEVYDVLKDEGYTLVTTGAKRPDVPARWFHLERRDYLRLLSACDVVISMSRLLEGWSRVVHEAMLCRSPVIGSGSGGMRELLEGGAQTVLDDLRDLPDATCAVLARGREQGSRGFEFARRFDLDYFETSWIKLAGRLARNKPGIPSARRPQVAIEEYVRNQRIL